VKRYISIDWGRKQDHTAITYLEREGDYPRWTFTVVEAIRYPLGTKFHSVLADVQTKPGPPGWQDSEHTLIIDASGIGDVLLEDMRREGLNPVGMIITGGGSASRDERDHRVWHVARNILVTTLKQRLGDTLHLRCSTDMAVLIAQEAANMQYTITSALHEHTEPRQGKHDDLLLSVSMAVWLGTNEGPPGYEIPQAEMQELWRQAREAGRLPPAPPPKRGIWSRRPW
jgi:hypothetical protein